MNLNDYPTPRTDVASFHRDNGVKRHCNIVVTVAHSEQLEREAAAWRDVARMHRIASTREEVQAADEAFDCLLAETQTP